MTKQHLDEECRDYVKGMLKAEIARKGVKQVELAQLMDKAFGVKETPQSLSNKINRGAFSAVFMYQVLKAIDCESLPIK